MYCVYLHINPVTKEVFYVGIGNSKRPYRMDSRSKWWTRVVNKYGIEVSVIEENLTWEYACEREIYYIKLYGRNDKGTGTLVNMTDGGEGIIGRIYSEEERKRIGERQKGRKNSEISKERLSATLKNMGAGKWNKGKRRSEEWKKQQGERSRGRTHSEETKLKMSKNAIGKKATTLGFKHTGETKLKMSAAQKGRTFTDESRKKMSLAQKGKTAWNKGLPAKPEEQERLRKMRIGLPSWNKGKNFSDESRKKMSESQRRIIKMRDAKGHFVKSDSTIKKIA